ncbi:MAG TPA: MBL fold metallo-hydrolase [Bacteroidia bacterium]|jgi:phosphoribosyl 1,2-cyclic phosphate phosphodiesterase|nr:MBL fold metallo-hydrolase [Bacteroidia bacterium]
MAVKLTFLGTGTSQGVPLVACPCAVCRSTNPKDKRLRSSVLVEHEGSAFVIDTGPDFRQQMLRENVKKLDAVIFTHEHNDHLIGLDDVRAFNFIQKTHMDVYATPRVQEAIYRVFPYIFSDNKYPGIPKLEMHTIEDEPFKIKNTDFLPINVMHHKLPVKAFRVGNITYITDANFISEEEKEKIKGSEIIIVNALRKEEHISHFTFEQAIALMQELKPKKAYFTHISHQLGLHEEIKNQLPGWIEPAYDGLSVSVQATQSL